MKILKYKTDKSFRDITKECEEYVKDKGTGTLLIYSKHTTLGVKVLEFEILSLLDTLNWMDKYIPQDDNYGHNRTTIREVPPNEPLNAHSHIRALLFNTSELVPVQDGVLQKGKWQSITLIELDEPRDREVILSFIKEL